MSFLKKLMMMCLPFAIIASCSSSPQDEPANPAPEPPPAQDSTTPEPEPEPEPTALTSVEFAKSMGAGWNLGNQFDAYNNGVASETAWGNPKATPQLFRKLKEYGFSTVRIPVTWLGQTGDAPDYTIKAEWLDRIAEVVGYAEDAGLKAIINIHHDGADGKNWLDPKGAAADPAKHEATKAQLKAMWTQIARKFADKGDFLIFESLNEIHDGGWGWGDNRKDGGKQYRVLNEWNQAFVDAVRAAGGSNATRFLSVPGYCTNPDLTISNFVKPTDSATDRILVAVHFYDPNTFAIEAKYTEWGHTGTQGKKDTWGDEDNVRNTFKKLHDKFIASGTGLYIGEWGATRRANEHDEKFRLYYISYVNKAAAERGIPLIFWDNGSTATGREAFGIIRHDDGTLLDKGDAVIRNIMESLDPAVTLQSIYDKAP